MSQTVTTLPCTAPPQADGWPMQRWQYEALVKLVRPDAQK